MKKTIRFLLQYKWQLLFALIAASLFYWYQLRPIIIYRTCAAQASADARTLLASKAEISKGTPQGTAYAGLIEKNLYLRTDYESFLMKCLLYHGLQLMPLDAKKMPPSGVTDPNQPVIQ